MTVSAKILSAAGCLVLLLCTASCDHAWSRLTGPNELGAATPTVHDEIPEGGIEGPIEPCECPVGGPKGGFLLCCCCNGSSCSN